MAPPYDPHAVPRAADANLSRAFDPWNSVGAGHQRADGKGVSGWREVRDLKLRGQFAAGHAGGSRGSGKLHSEAAHGCARAGRSVADLLRRQAAGLPATSNGGGRCGTASAATAAPENAGPVHCAENSARNFPAGARGTDGVGQSSSSERLTAARRAVGHAAPPEQQGAQKEEEEAEGRQKNHHQAVAVGDRRILDGLVVYVNGSTHPAISDHRLKRVLVENGARVSLHLARRQVTHVILGRPASAGGAGSGAGGGLAGGKLEREIRRVGGCGVKYVGVEWVLESIKSGKRLPEAKFANLKLATKGQQSVYGAFSNACSKNLAAQGATPASKAKSRSL